MRVLIAFLIVLGAIYLWDANYNNGSLTDGGLAYSLGIGLKEARIGPAPPPGGRAGASFRTRYKLPKLIFSVAPLQLNFCSCFGTAHFNLRPFRGGFNFAHRAGVHFINTKFLNPVRRRAKMPAAFCFA